MGLSKSKAPKPGQPSFQNQSGFSSTPQMSNQSPFSSGQLSTGFPGQSGFGTTPGFGGTNFGQPPAQGFGAQPGFSSNQMGFPPFPSQSQQPLTGFPPSSLFQNPLGPPLAPSSGYPVSYQNQSKRKRNFLFIYNTFFF